jgi:hypothetical protein
MTASVRQGVKDSDEQARRISQALIACLPLTVLAVTDGELAMVNALRKARGKKEIPYSTIHLALARSEGFWDGYLGREIQESLQRSGFQDLWAEMPAGDRAEAINAARALAELEVRRFVASFTGGELEAVNILRRAEGRPALSHSKCQESVSRFWDGERGQKLKPLTDTPFWEGWLRIPGLNGFVGMEMVRLAERLDGMMTMAEELLPEPQRRAAWDRVWDWVDQLVWI